MKKENQSLKANRFEKLNSNKRGRIKRWPSIIKN